MVLSARPKESLACITLKIRTLGGGTEQGSKCRTSHMFQKSAGILWSCSDTWAFSHSFISKCNSDCYLLEQYGYSVLNAIILLPPGKLNTHAGYTPHTLRQVSLNFGPSANQRGLNFWNYILFLFLFIFIHIESPANCVREERVKARANSAWITVI